MGNLEEIILYLKPSRIKRQKRRDKRLHKELTECYRLGGKWAPGKGYFRRFVGNEFEYARNKEGMKLRHMGDRKFFNDNLIPLRRFLIARRGVAWKEVYGELCRKLDKRSATGLHVFEHLKQMVELHVEIVEGVVLRNTCHFFNCSVIRSRSQSNPTLFVHPETGQLTEAPRHYSRKALRKVFGDKIPMYLR